MSSGFRKKGQKSYALERYPELRKKLEKENPKLKEWAEKEAKKE